MEMYPNKVWWNVIKMSKIQDFVAEPSNLLLLYQIVPQENV